MSVRPRSALVASIALHLSAIRFGTAAGMRPNLADGPSEPFYSPARYYIVSQRREHGLAQRRYPKQQRHTSRVKSRKRTRCKAKRRSHRA